MKKILLLLFSAVLFGSATRAQECKCNTDVKFTITNWVCKGKNAAGNPVYAGKLTIANNSKCKLTLIQIMQQVGGDVALALPVSVAALSTSSFNISFTDMPPVAAAGSTPFFIVVYSLNNVKCKFEFPSDKIPLCEVACDCNTNGWQPFTAQIKNQAIQVKCGYQFSLTCNDTVSLKGAYKCLGSCSAKYTAVLKNTVTNAVVQNYPSFTFGWWYRFMTAGSYSLEITPICGDKKCQPCRFFFTVTCATCDCNPDGWQPYDATVNKVTKKVNCGFQFSLKPNQAITLNSKYVCKGTCSVKYVAVLKNNVTNVAIQNYSPFNFPWTYSFPAEGNYRLEIIPVCGDKKCQPCVFYFTVKKP